MLRLIAAVLAAAGTALAQPSLQDLAMPDARVLFGANLERLRETKLAGILWSRISGWYPQQAARLQAAGFDPLRDLSEVLVAAPAGLSRQHALLLARGALSQADLSSLYAADGAHREAFAGGEIITWEKQKEAFALALLGDGLIIAGAPSSVRGAIARRAGPQAPAELRRKAARLSAQYDAWGVSIVPVAEMLAQTPQSELTGLLRGGVLEAVEQVSGGLRAGAELDLTLNSVSRTGQDAARLADALRFFATLAQSRRPGAPPLIKDLSVDGRTMSLSLAMAESELEGLLRVAGFGRRANPAPPKPEEAGAPPAASPSDREASKAPQPKPPQ